MLYDSQQKTRLFLIEAGIAGYREYILRDLAAGGIEVVLVTDREPTWERAHVTDVIVTSLQSKDEVLRILQNYHARSPVDGLLTYLETSIELAAHVSEHMGFRFLGSEVARNARNKGIMRELFRRSGLPVPRCERYDGSLRGLAGRIGLPLVVKPVSGFSSINVLKVERDADLGPAEERLQRWQRESNSLLGDDFLIEEYIAGPELSVESIVCDGDIRHIAVTDKAKGPEPFFEEVGQTVPAAVDGSVRSLLCETASRGIRALGIRSGATHTEIRLCAERGAVIMEIGARLAGDKIPFLVGKSTGINMSLAATFAAVGRYPVLTPTLRGAATIAYFVPRKKQQLRSVPSGVPPVPGLIEFEFAAQAGQVVSPPPDSFFTRLGHVVVTGETPSASQAAANAVLRWITERTGLELMPMTWAFDNLGHEGTVCRRESENGMLNVGGT